MKKRILSIILSLALVLTLLPVTALPVSAEVLTGPCGAEGSNVTYTYDTGTRQLTISGTGAMQDYTDVWDIPWYDRDQDCSLVEKLVVEEGVTRLGDLALFFGYMLKSVTLPDSLKEIGESAFGYCRTLESIQLPINLTGIGKSAFEFCEALKEVNIPAGVTEIGDRAFIYCQSLESIEIPSGVTRIGQATFDWCSSLTSAKLPDGITDIESFAFTRCSSLKDFKLPASLTSIGDYAFESCSSLTSIAIPDGVTRIGEYAFYDCDALEDITMGNNVTSIGAGAFAGTGYRYKEENWENGYLYLGNWLFAVGMQLSTESVKAGTVGIMEYAFNNCYAPSIVLPSSMRYVNGLSFAGGFLRDISVVSDNPFLVSVDGVLFNRERTELIRFPGGRSGNYTVPNSVKRIADGAFSSAWHLEGVSLPQGLTELGADAFVSCMSMESIVIPGSVESISDGAFEYCRGLASVTIGKGVQSIGYCSFFYCDSLKSIEIPDSVTSIDTYAFKGCRNLERVTIGTGVQSVGYEAFYDCDSLKSVVIPQSVTYIGDWAFGYAWDSSNDDDILIDGFTIFGYAGSEAETYAEDYEIPFVSLPTQFYDVFSGKYYVDGVAWAVENGVTSGLTATSFGPDATCTRGQVVTFLWRASGSPEPSSDTHPFTDLQTGKFYYKAVLWAVENGITSGTSKTTFGPDAACTRGQVVTFLWRAEGKPAPTSLETSFTDVDSKGYYYQAMCWAVEQGVTTGTSTTTFTPNRPCTRGQIVTFLYRDLG